MLLCNAILPELVKRYPRTALCVSKLQFDESLQILSFWLPSIFSVIIFQFLCPIIVLSIHFFNVFDTRANGTRRGKKLTRYLESRNPSCIPQFLLLRTEHSPMRGAAPATDWRPPLCVWSTIRHYFGRITAITHWGPINKHRATTACEVQYATIYIPLHSHNVGTKVYQDGEPTERWVQYDQHQLHICAWSTMPLQ